MRIRLVASPLTPAIIRGLTPVPLQLDQVGVATVILASLHVVRPLGLGGVLLGCVRGTLQNLLTRDLFVSVLIEVMPPPPNGVSTAHFLQIADEEGGVVDLVIATQAEGFPDLIQPVEHGVPVMRDVVGVHPAHVPDGAIKLGVDLGAHSQEVPLDLLLMPAALLLAMASDLPSGRSHWWADRVHITLQTMV